MSIASRITSIEGHIGDIYDSVELTGVDTTDIDKNLVNVPNTLKEGYVDIINNGTDTLYNNFPKVSGEGTSLTLNNTYQAPMRNNLKGNTSQTGTPTPTSPTPVNVVSGDNSIEICGKNLFDITKISANTFINTSGATGTSSSTNLSDYTNVEPNVQYYLKYDYTSLVNSNTRSYCYYNENKVLISGDTYSPVNKTTSFTPPNNAKYIRFAYDKNCSDIKFIKTNELSTYSINLPSGMELCKIGNYQDYIYKDSDKWYLHKEIGKVVLNGSETWVKSSNTSIDRFVNTNVARPDMMNFTGYSNYFVNKPAGQTTIGFAFDSSTGDLVRGRIIIDFSAYGTTTLEQFKTWLSSHNTSIYFVNGTPTANEVEYQPLIDQLNELEKAISYENQTNISQVNNDLGFIINASALKKG